MSTRLAELHQKAIESRTNSYSPYSGFKVGSAVLTTDGKIYYGANIENASYGGTVCAERVAIWKMISENKNARIQEIVVVTDSSKAWPPCGLCRQVMTEFADDSTKVHIGNLQGIQRVYSLGELIPESFRPADLGKK